MLLWRRGRSFFDTILLRKALGTFLMRSYFELLVVGSFSGCDEEKLGQVFAGGVDAKFESQTVC